MSRPPAAALLLALLLAAAPARAAEPRIRVLLAETSLAVQVGAVGGRLATIEAVPGGGLRADAHRVGAVWSLEGAVLRVDRLRVRGGVEVRRVPGGLRVVNRVPLEDYVAGTLGREVYPSWQPEMLKAQAVAIRTYALHEADRHAQDGFDVDSGTRGQVYGGLDAETPAVVSAAAATRGQWLAWQGRPILAAFHSASGGRTASAAEVWGRPLPYLVTVEVPDEEDSPDTYWRASIARTKLGPALAPLGVQVGPIQEIWVVERSESGRVRKLRVRGRDGEADIGGRALRQALGADVIRSTLFDVHSTRDALVFVGSGSGHGVGMSQWGAQAMARRGASYREILAAFYPGTELVGGGAP